jgi:hypothetical protein
MAARRMGNTSSVLFVKGGSRERHMTKEDESDSVTGSSNSKNNNDDSGVSMSSTSVTQGNVAVDHSTKDSSSTCEMEVGIPPPEETEESVVVRGENDNDMSSDTSLEEKDEDKPKAKFSVGSVVYARDQNWGNMLYRGVIRRLVYGPVAHANSIGSEADCTMFELSHEAATTTTTNAHECWYYYIHYYKWANKWERFVPEMDVFPDTEEVREMANQMAKANSNRKNKKRKGSNAALQLTDQVVQQRKQEEEDKQILLKREEERKQEEDNKKQMTAKQNKVIQRELKLKEIHLGPPRTTVKYADRLFIPPPLQKILVEEWDLITANKRNDTVQRVLPNLPADVTVKDALDRYLQSKLTVLHLESNSSNSKNTMMKEEWMQMVDGIATLFDQMLPCAILYEQEIQQYKCMGGSTTATKTSTGRNQIGKDNGGSMKSHTTTPCMSAEAKRNCEIYGCSYLLRLIVKLPQMLTDLPRQDLSITAKIGDLIHYLHVNNKVLFSQTYRKPFPHELTLEEREAKKTKLCP